ncbi:DUF4280 domain-containing protein [Chryseobacterium contaminans]|uniref:DUF4280 domain-containing protein n=1 Tax=Chryseobacterium contaminans TaxID=1423959 RepID=UPI0030164941
MPQKITDTAQLSCNQGTTPSNLSVTSQNFSTAEGKYIATEQDKQTNVNIKPFGQCKLKPTSGGYLPCIPAPVAWGKTTEKDTINNYKILTEDSFCMCSTGGKISIENKGHKEEHDLR